MASKAGWLFILLETLIQILKKLRFFEFPRSGSPLVLFPHKEGDFSRVTWLFAFLFVFWFLFFLFFFLFLPSQSECFSSY
jgi:hypothetical protein